MSVPGGQVPNRQSSNGWTIALVVLAVVGVSMLVCCGGLGVIGGLVYTRLDKARVQGKPAGGVPQGQTTIQWDSDTWAEIQLMPAYTAAADAVAADKQVLEKLGDPVEMTGEADSLFRRENKGQWSGGEEPIEFDVQGPKGKAAVRVVVASKQELPGMAPGGYSTAWPKSIKVKLEDGSEIDVPPPESKQEP